jgi:hypothetical protein
LADNRACAPKPRGGSHSGLEDYAERILDLIAEQPDRTLDELVAAMRSGGFRAAAACSSVFLIVTTSLLKKSLQAAEPLRAYVASARRRWIRQQKLSRYDQTVFIDETATSTNMVRRRGRCPRRALDYSHVPQRQWKTMTFVAALGQ